MDYQAFATTLSLVGVVTSGTVMLITLRRALVERRNSWIRRFDGPVTTVLFLIAVLTLIPAVLANSPEYVTVGRIAISIVRGLIVGISLLILGQLWVIRETWLR